MEQPLHARLDRDHQLTAVPRMCARGIEGPTLVWLTAPPPPPPCHRPPPDGHPPGGCRGALHPAHLLPPPERRSPCRLAPSQGYGATTSRPMWDHVGNW